MANESPQSGDVLVTIRTATLDHDILVFPNTPHATVPHYERAISTARELAESLRVDVWFTQDHTHFLPVASFRAPRAPRPQA